jgi:hypothetical protein
MDRLTQQKRDGILDEIRRIERLRQGTISEQFYGRGKDRQGPYYVLQGYTDGKHWSKRVPRDQVEQVREDLGAGTRFKELCGKFAELTEQATMAEDQPSGKKNASKRSRNATGKPKRS